MKKTILLISFLLLLVLGFANAITQEVTYNEMDNPVDTAFDGSSVSNGDSCTVDGGWSVETAGATCDYVNTYPINGNSLSGHGAYSSDGNVYYQASGDPEHAEIFEVEFRFDSSCIVDIMYVNNLAWGVSNHCAGQYLDRGCGETWQPAWSNACDSIDLVVDTWYNITVYHLDNGTNVLYFNGGSTPLAHCNGALNKFGFETQGGGCDMFWSNARFYNNSDPDVGYPTILVTIEAPTNLTSLKAVNITNGNVWINASDNFTGSPTYTVNDSDFTYIGAGASSDAVFRNNTYLADGRYHVRVSANGTGTISGMSTVVFGLDVTNPEIDASEELRLNQTVIVNGTFSQMINFSDNLEIYSVKISFENGSMLLNYTDLGVPKYHANVTNMTEDNTYITARTCDAHTAQFIDEMRVDFTGNGLKFVTNDRPFLQKDDYIQVYPKVPGSFSKASTQKQYDRYTFTFNKHNAASPVEQFIVEATSQIDIAHNQHYKGHLIIPNLNDGYWIDFENDDVEIIDITRLAYNKVEVVVKGLTGNTFTFNSIGELNCIEQNYYFSDLKPIIGYEQTAIAGETLTMSLDILLNPPWVSTVNATLFYNKTLYYGGTTDNYSISLTAPTTTGNYTDVVFNWSAIIGGTSYDIGELKQNVSNFYLENCSEFGTRALNFTLRNITNDGVLNGTLEYNFDYTYGSTTKNFSMIQNVNNGSDICIYPPYLSGLTTDIEVVYGVGGTEFTYKDTASLDNQSELIDLYITGGTDIVTFTVTDSTDKPMVGAIIKIYEWNVGEGVLKLSQQLETDINGQTVGNLVLYNTDYKFQVLVNGEMFLNTDPAKVISNSVNFVLNLQTDYYDEAVTPIGGYSTLEWDNVSDTYIFQWTDLPANVNEACIVVNSVNINGETQFGKQCGTDIDGAAIVSIPEATQGLNGTFIATGYFVVDEKDIIPVDTDSVSFGRAHTTFGLDGVWISFFVVLTVTLVGIFSINVAIILMILSISLMIVLGIFYLPVASVAAIIAVGVVMIVRLNRK